MVPEDRKAFISNTIALVEQGAVPMARIDDAVTASCASSFAPEYFNNQTVQA
jgi:hypothetical protein